MQHHLTYKECSSWLQKYEYTIQDKPGKDMILADRLSRDLTTYTHQTATIASYEDP